MIGIIIVTHGSLAREFIAVAEHVVGKQTQLVPIGIGPDEDMEKCRQSIHDAIIQTDTGEGVIMLTDMFGGTPSNLAISVMQPGKVEVIAGINVPMLVKLLSVRATMPLMEATFTAQEAGRKYINIASNLLKKSA